MDRPAADLYPDWPQYAARLRDAIVRLDAGQLAIRASHDHAPIWALAAHAAGGRVYWRCGVFGEPGADATPWPSPTGEGWEDDESHPRSGEELAWALDSSWAVIRSCLERWTVEDLMVTATRPGSGQTYSRASILNRIITHDAFHAGEISQLLGRHGIGEVNLWSPRAS